MVLGIGREAGTNNKQIFYLKAVNPDIEIGEWKLFRKKIGKLYDRVAIRHLDFKRSQ